MKKIGDPGNGAFSSPFAGTSLAAPSHDLTTAHGDRGQPLHPPLRRLRKLRFLISCQAHSTSGEPLAYATQGIPPSDYYIADLMHSLDLPYYIGLLSAAALHGAAHQQVQQLQIVVPRQERPLGLPGLSIRFFRKQDFTTTPLQSRKGHSGLLPVSTPEATAFDLIRYSRYLGGLDAVMTVLSELAEFIDPAKLAAASASESETAQIQRLGWLLDHLGQTTLADALHATLPSSKPLPRAALDPGAPRTGPITGNRWRILENAQPEADL